MKQFKFFIAVFFTLFLIACAKPLPADKTHFAGQWQNDDGQVNLIITNEGRVEYSNQRPGKSTSVSAPITKFEGNNFKVGLGPLSTEFKVNQPPNQDAQGYWHMTVDGYELSKTR